MLQREVEGEPWPSHFTPLYDQALKQHYADAVTYSRKAGLIRSDVDVEQLLDTRFVEQGLKQLQLQDYWKAD